MQRHLAMEMVRVTEAAALAAARVMGRGDADLADHAAVEAMREEFNYIGIRGTVRIGEGERDEAPMLFIGEEVGQAGPDDPEVDIAVDPLEGTTICARGDNNALAVVAIAAPGCLLHAPDTYMEKIAVGPDCAGIIDISRPPTENLYRIAARKEMSINELTVCILDRDRHKELIAEVRRAGARIRLIRDGDVSAAMATAVSEGPVDVLMGIGGAPEGVLAAAALRALGGDMQGRLRFRNDGERERAIAMGIEDPDRVFGLTDLASGDVIFSATGVTDGDFLQGVRFDSRGASTHSVVMRSASGTVRYVTARHDFTRGYGMPRMPV
ncbi:MAG: class II fructose-bisphosphatase [Deltaproteobacteria bacterium]|nr:class II fructose-bisphosphatase [Deltaproteobacteria bacterium]